MEYYLSVGSEKRGLTAWPSWQLVASVRSRW